MKTFDSLKEESDLARIEAQNKQIEQRLIKLTRRVELIEHATMRAKLRELDELLLEVKKIQNGGDGFWSIRS